MSRAKKKSRKANPRVQRRLRPDEEMTRVVVDPLAAASAEAFVANPEPDARPAFEDDDDMGDYLGEIVFVGARTRNDVALDMETLQPLAPRAEPVPTVTVGAKVSQPQVRASDIDFEDAPTLPDSRHHVRVETTGDSGAPDLAAFDREPFGDRPLAERSWRPARVSGR